MAAALTMAQGSAMFSDCLELRMWDLLLYIPVMQLKWECFKLKADWFLAHLHWQSASSSAQCGNASLAQPLQQMSQTPRNHLQEHAHLQGPLGWERSLGCPQTVLGRALSLLSQLPGKAQLFSHLYKKRKKEKEKNHTTIKWIPDI